MQVIKLVDAGQVYSDIQMLPHNGDMISSEEVEQIIQNALNNALVLSEHDLTHMENDTIAYIYLMERDGRAALTDSRRALLSKLQKFRSSHFEMTATGEVK